MIVTSVDEIYGVDCCENCGRGFVADIARLGCSYGLNESIDYAQL